jgi:tetratricopeptide (TPR) repeat protein
MQNQSLTKQEDEAIANAIHYGLELHRNGILDQAESLYTGVLKLAPGHGEALHFLGVLRNQQGHVEEALELMAAAAAVNAGWTELHVNYALALNGARRHAEALASAERALAIDAGNPDGHFQRGNALMGLARLAEALAAFDRALALAPGHVDAMVNRGNALVALERFHEAVTAFEGATAISPQHAGILNNYGQALHGAGRSEAALAAFDRALAIDPDYIDARTNRAQTLVAIERPAEALADLDSALAREPRHRTALCARGLALTGLDRYEEAIAAFNAAVAVDPDFGAAYNNRGQAQAALNRYDEARASFEIALEITPDLAAAKTNAALACLVAGDFERGLWLYEARPQPQRSFAAPLWLGREPLAGKTLALHAEQGMGDTLQCVRYARLAVAQGATVVVEAQPPLVSLIASMPEVALTVTQGLPLPACDLRCPMLSLPLAFGTTPTTIPAEVPYLGAPPARAAHWKTRFAREVRPGALKVGLVWAGNRNNKNDRNRSIAAARLEPLLAAPGVRWIALQAEVEPRDRAWLAAHPEVLDIGSTLSDFADCAGAMAALDLVLSVDTATVHLAGALALPVWVMLPFSPDWRWMLGRSDSPWYPTARLFRQPAPGDWDVVLAQVVAALPEAFGAPSN